MSIYCYCCHRYNAKVPILFCWISKLEELLLQGILSIAREKIKDILKTVNTQMTKYFSHEDEITFFQDKCFKQYLWNSQLFNWTSKCCLG